MKATILTWWKWLMAQWEALWSAPAPTWALPPHTQRDPASLEQQVRRAHEARSLLEHPLFVEAAREVEGRLEHWRRNVPLADQIMHTRLIVAGQQWDIFKGFLVETLTTGALASRDLMKRESAAHRLRESFRRGIRA
jgi:hypothetical protein